MVQWIKPKYLFIYLVVHQRRPNDTYVTNFFFVTNPFSLKALNDIDGKDSAKAQVITSNGI